MGKVQVYYNEHEPGSFPLANGAPSRVGRIRAYGNALCSPQAESFIVVARQIYEKFRD